MNFLVLFGILSGLFKSQTSGDKIFQKMSEKISCKQRKNSTEKPSFVIHQYIGHDTFTDKAIKGLDEKLKRLIVLLQDKVGIPDDRNQAIFSGPASSCKEIHEQNRSRGNEAYLLRMDYGSVPVYCHMTSSDIGACGGGGWSLAMKIDGEKRTFHYDSHYWSDKEHFNLDGGKTLFDSQETKLPTYWNTPFSKICLGMKIGHQFKFIVVNKHANSLHSLIADGKYRNTSLGSNTWKTLIGSYAFLATGCTKAGFNVYQNNYAARTRIGIVGGEYCTNSYSRIGFGSGGYPDDTNTCGNEAHQGKNSIRAMGYILVQ